MRGRLNPATATTKLTRFLFYSYAVELIVEESNNVGRRPVGP